METTLEYKMEPELKAKWVGALRSGEYRQATGRLYDKNASETYGKPAMCCLGVLEHICGTELKDMIENYEGETIGMPSQLENPKSPNIFILDDEELSSPGCLLANMNDGNQTQKIEKHSFEEIADWIEKNL